jgi:hypothetical protein
MLSIDHSVDCKTAAVKIGFLYFCGFCNKVEDLKGVVVVPSFEKRIQLRHGLG